MSRFHSHISSAIRIIEAYKGEEPFVHSIRKYFAANKKYGSKDRRSVSTLCYNYFRAGAAFKDRPMEDKILLSSFLCGSQDNELLAFFYPKLNEQIGLPVEEKLPVAQADIQQLFPFKKELSAEIDQEQFIASFLEQPKLFLRIRPGRAQILQAKLTEAGIAFEPVGDDCISVSNSTSLEEKIAINRDAVIQDLSSQHVLDFLDERSFSVPPGKKLTAWDCCAASGGKSILLHDKLKGKVQLTVSDIRKNILHNCEKRLQQARVDIYKSFVADLTQKNISGFEEKFPVIICDAPCTGSGTWGRTPEQLSFFKEGSIDEYVQKQRTIATNSLSHLQEDGLFFYITCSVFKKENEDVVEFLQQQKNVKLLHQQYYKGYEMQADTMFVAVFIK